MSNQIAKILSIFMAVLFAITAIFGLLFYVNIVPLKPLTLVDIPDNMMKYVNWILLYSVILLLAVVFVSFVVNPVLKIISNPKGVLRTIISIVILAVIVGIAFALSSTEPVHLIGGDKIPSDSSLILADTTLYASYILTGLVVIAIIASEVKRLLKF